MSFEPLVPLWLIVVLLAGLLAAWWRSYAGRGLGAVVRLGAIVVLGVMLGNPVRIDPVTTPAASRLALVQDSSASMARTDAEGGSARLEAAASGLRQVATGLGAGYAVEQWHLDAALTSGFATTATGGTSFLPLTRLLGSAGTPGVVAIVLASDGGDYSSEDGDDQLAAAHVPVFCLPVGGPAPAPNIAVRLESPSPSAFVGQDLELSAVVIARGGLAGRQVELTVRAAEDGREVLRQTVTLGEEARVAVPVAAGGTAGTKRWDAEVTAIPGEASILDNRAGVAVQVVDRAIRIAVLEGQPWWDTTFALRAWRRDRQLQVGSVFRLGSRQWRSGSAPATFTAESLAGVDVVVLGDQVAGLLDEAAQTAITTWVDQGGSLLWCGISSGQRGPLAVVDPLLRQSGRHTRVLPVSTAAGRRLSLVPADATLSPVEVGTVAGLRPRTEVLLGSESQPLVVWRRHGGGRIAVVNGEGMWRWTLGQSDGEVAARFWRQLVKALVQGQGAGLSADRANPQVGQEVQIAVSGTSATVQVTAPDGSRGALPVSAGVARVPLDAVGWWQVRDGAAELWLAVAAEVREVVDTARRDDRLARLAGRTGGAVLTLAEAGRLAERLRRRADLAVAEPQRHPWVTTPWWLLAISGLLAGEWFWRRRVRGVV